MSKLSILCAAYKNTDHELNIFIHSILAQTFKDYTCFILSDGPDEKIQSLCNKVKDKRIVYSPSKEHLGKFGYINRQRKLFEIDSKYVTFQSADNYVVPKAYEFLINALESQNADLILCNVLHNYANINSWNRDGSQDKTKFSPPYSVLDSKAQLNKCDISNFVVRTELAVGAGGFNLELPDRLVPGTDGFFIEALIAKYRGQLKALKLQSCLMVHN